jgi:hypothetical protein
MSLELIILVSLILLLFVLKTLAWNKLASKEPAEEKFEWKPDLSHHVVITEHSAPRHWGGNQQTIVLTKKSPEQSAEDRRTYLKENRK